MKTVWLLVEEDGTITVFDSKEKAEYEAYGYNPTLYSIVEKAVQ